MTVPCFAEHHSIVYDNPGTEQVWVAAVYGVVTCGALIASSHRVVDLVHPDSRYRDATAS